MKNILYCNGNTEYLDEIMINKINKSQKVDNSYVIVGYTDEKILYMKESKCLLRDDCVIGNYIGYTEEMISNCEPLDDEILLQIAPYFLDIMKMQQRFEEMTNFRISKTLDAHYQLLIQHLFFWNNFLDDNKITNVLFTDVPHEGYDNVIYYLCQKKSISMLLWRKSILPGRAIVIKEYEKIAMPLTKEYAKLRVEYEASENDEIVLEPKVQKYFDNMCSENKIDRKIAYTTGNTRETKFRRRYGERKIYKIFKSRLYSRVAQYKHQKIKMIKYILINLFPVVYSLFTDLGKIFFIKSMWRKTKTLEKQYQLISEVPASGERYIYYAFHYIPEVTSAPLGGVFYEDQLIPLKVLSQSIPIDWKIYVKIHPAQLAHNCSIKIFQDIKKIKNVRLISEICDSYNLIENSVAVSTLTGSIAMEAQFCSKPVLIFGYSEKQAAPMSYSVRTKKDCKSAIDDIKLNKKSTNKKDLKIFIKALENVSFDDNKEDFLNALLKRLSLQENI